MNLELEALIIRYKAAAKQLKTLPTTEERMDLLADVVFPSEFVYNASISVAGRKVKTYE